MEKEIEMRILPNLQSLIGPLPGRDATPPKPSKPAKGIPTTLSFIDQAAISTQASEVPARRPAGKIAQAVKQLVRRAPQRHEQLLATAQQAGAVGRIARHHAADVIGSASAVVASGAAKIRMIPAKAIDFGFDAHPAHVKKR